MKKITNHEDLNEYQFRFILRLLAYHDTIEDAAEIFKMTYGTPISVELVSRMSPLNEGHWLTDDQVEFFYEKRQNMINAAVLVPVCDKLWRVMKYQKLLTYFEQAGNFKMVTKVMEIMDRETGPLYQELVKYLKLDDEINNGTVEAESVSESQ